MRFILILFLFVFGATAAIAQHASRTIPKRPHLIRTATERNSEHSGADAVRTVRVLALRMQFKQENPNNPSTSGNGHFDLGSAPSGRTLDLPPHNKVYFEDHMLAMRNYFLDVSDSNLLMEYTVKPDGLDDAIALDTFMAYYGILGTQEQRDIRLAEFFRDAVVKANTQNMIDFSAYDYVVIFHAGVGQDFSNEDNTPNDLSSRFVSLNLLRKRYGNDFEGIPVNGGTVRFGVVVPETESQELIDPVFGIDVFTEIGLTGILCANFGSALGMPDMFNTQNGRPGIGVFGLEDQGAVNGDGLIPAEPDPWTKIFMGWARPVRVSDSVQLQLVPKKLAGKSVILKVPINASEYFLIENKQRDVIPNSLSTAEISRIDTIDNGDGTLTIDTVYLAGVTISPSTGVITRVDEYDNALPGNGLLIWHVDENIIRQNLETNSINNDLNRGVRLVEGSGSQDIGFLFSAGPFSSVDAGNRFDFYFRGNEAFAFYNHNVDSVFLTPTSVPSSLANDRSYSGIFITRISPLQTLMTFDLRSSALKPGFPAFAGSVFETNALAAGNIMAGIQQEVVAVGVSGDIFAWQWNGQRVIPSTETRTVYGIGGDSSLMPVALFAKTSDSVFVSPTLGDLDGDGLAEVIAGDGGGQLYVWRAIDNDLNGRADTLFTRRLHSPVTASPVFLPGSRIAVGCANGSVHVWNSTGQSLIEIQRSAPITGLSAIGTDTLVVATEDEIGVVKLSTGGFSTLANGEFLSTATGDLAQSGKFNLVAFQHGQASSFLSALDGWPFSIPELVVSSPSIADVDQDGFLEVLFGADNAVYAYNHNGTLAPNFPIYLDRTVPAGLVQASILIADADGDEQADIITAAPDGKVYAWNRTGRLLQGFPLATGRPIYSTPVIVDLEGDGNLDVVSVSEDGFVYAWEAPGRQNAPSIRWGQWMHDASRTAHTLESNVIPAPGGSLMPRKRVYNYPNPARGVSTAIRYYLSEASTVKIRIFDMAGDFVAALTGSGISQTENEVVWNLGNIAGGIYFAKVEARSVSGRKETRTIKIAVTR